MALEEYREKRDFEKTSEPAGGADAAAPAGGLLYVIQKHAARRLHYDFRLELDGVLLSWAVPKGPSLNPRDRHLAARVEDHPVEYGTFEGTIPQGEYGAGTVELWDRGTWQPEGDPHAGLEKGDLKFTLHGEKLRGSWVLVRMKGRPGEEGKENWLLIKHRDDYAVDGDGSAVLVEHDRSVASGRTLDEITAGAGASVWHGDRSPDKQTDAHPGEEFSLDPASLTNAHAVSQLPRFLAPELATLVEKAPEGDKWLHEVKFDGYRALSRIEDGRAEMRSRNDKDWTSHFALIAADLVRLPVTSAMLDGEVVVQMPDGTTSFQELQTALGTDRSGRYPRQAKPASDSVAPHGDGGAGGRLLYYAFDLLYLDGYELLDTPLEERKELLKRLLSRQPGGLGATRVMYSEHIAGDGAEFLSDACGLGLEGMMSKASGSRYRAGVRGGDWLKTKCRHEQEFVIGGYTDPAGARAEFGALLVGVHENGVLRYVGKVGTGFSDVVLADLGRRLRDIAVDAPPFTTDVKRAPKGCHWVRPELVAQVAFAEWTRDGDLRHASFKGLREDKPASEVVGERPAGEPAAAPEATAILGPVAAEAAPPPPSVSQPPAKSRRPGPAAPPHPSSGESVTLTHPDRVFWPADGTTKQALADYYATVAHLMLPYVVGRPISMVRCPEGVDGPAGARRPGGRGGPCFFHKHPGADFKGPLNVVSIVESEGPNPYFTITEPAGLTALAQMGVLEIHVWGATWPDIEHADMLVFDFDPDPAVEWEMLADAARLMRDVLKALGLQTFVKTTGGKGLHVVAPITPREDWATVRDFCKAIADAFVATAPERFTANMLKAKRAGKIYVDYVRNTRGSTSIAPYSTRAREHATVSVPLRWEELSGEVRPASFTVLNLGERLRALTGDPWEGFHEAGRAQTITDGMKRAVGLG
jgi:bifunctional non-homologous end joining protein LigD